MHTLPLSHAPRRESGAPHRFPGPAHRAAPHPRAGVLKTPVSSQAEFLRQLRAQAGSGPGVRALGVAQRPRTHASAPGGAPEAPPMQPFPNSRAWEKRFFFSSPVETHIARMAQHASGEGAPVLPSRCLAFLNLFEGKTLHVGSIALRIRAFQVCLATARHLSSSAIQQTEDPLFFPASR